MRIALISDIHGNHLALQAVLRDAEAQGVTQFACLGDVATLGPQPTEVLQTLRQLACPCILGNHDAFLLEPELVAAYTQAPIIVDAVDWCRNQLSPADFGTLRDFLPEHQIPLPAGQTLALFHGSPLSHTEDLLATTPADRLDAMLGGRRAAVMAGGHTHIQMLRQHRGTWLVNPGSVGLPFREYVDGARPEILPHAEYAIVEASDPCGAIAVHLRKVPLDRDALRQQTRSWRNGPAGLRADLLLQYT